MEWTDVVTRLSVPATGLVSDRSKLISDESKRLQGCFFVQLIGFALLVTSLYVPVVFIQVYVFKRSVRHLSALWPSGLDPLAVGLGMTSLTITMVIAVGVTQFPSLSAVQKGKEPVDAYVRAMHLMQTAHLVAVTSGILLLTLVPLMALGDGYRVISAVVLALLGLLCFRLSCTVPVPVDDWNRYIEEQKEIVGKMTAETKKRQSGVTAQAALVTHLWWRLVLRVVFTGVIVATVLSGITALIVSLQEAEARISPAGLIPALGFGSIAGIYIQGVIMWGLYGFPTPEYGDRDMAWFRATMASLSWLIIMLNAALLAREHLITIALCTISALFAFQRSRPLRELRDISLEKRSLAAQRTLTRYKQFRDARRISVQPSRTPSPMSRRMHVPSRGLRGTPQLGRRTRPSTPRPPAR